MLLKKENPVKEKEYLFVFTGVGQTQRQTVSADFYSLESINAIDCEDEDK